ncbi:MAG: Gfo/Idh/MocA family oxidoreductase [Phycisphaeraceae bacterium]
MIKVAIVGLGGIGNNHARCYRTNPHTQLVAVCDIDKERADKAAAEHGCPAFYSVPDLLDADVTFDAASVCTAGEENGGDHFEPTMQLLEAGIPVLGEKPISNRLASAEKMIALARDKHLPYAINLNHRFTPAARQARQWLDDGRLGPVNFVNMFMWINNPNESSPHFHMRALHPHSIDVMRYFGGEVKKVHAFFKKGDGRAIWSNVHVNMLFENGTLGHLMGSYDGGGPGTPWGLERCEVVGGEAKFVIEDACEKLVFTPRHNLQQETYDHPGNMKSFGDTFQSRIDAWVDDLRHKVAPDKVDGKAEDALKAQQIIEAAIASWETGTVVELENT